MYEAAFAWRDCQGEVAWLLELFDILASGGCQAVLECACGSAPHAPGFVARGMSYHGFDEATAMLAYAQRRTPEAQLQQAVFTPSNLPRVDLACCLLGSLYLKSAAELKQHLDRLAAAVRPGGLYILDWCMLWDEPTAHQDLWLASYAGRPIKVCYDMSAVENDGLVTERLWIGGDDFQASGTTRQYPFSVGHFHDRVAAHADWEWAGAWNDWDLSAPLPAHDCAEVVRPVTALRRR